MNKGLVTLLLLVFLLGWLGSNLYRGVFMDAEWSLQKDEAGTIKPVFASKERISPSDRIKESQIKVYDDKVIISLDNPEWSRFTNTNSMDPIIDAGANAIHIVPESEDEIEVGDIIAYKSEYTDGTVIHRVVEIGEDEKGTYFILKGDNNPDPDPGKVRFEQIERVLVAIIY